jgi:hypothetical protein
MELGHSLFAQANFHENLSVSLKMTSGTDAHLRTGINMPDFP